jgi:hypothetical protein
VRLPRVRVKMRVRARARVGFSVSVRIRVTIRVRVRIKVRIRVRVRVRVRFRVRVRVVESALVSTLRFQDIDHKPIQQMAGDLASRAIKYPFESSYAVVVVVM